MIVFPALRALRFGQAHAAGKSFLQSGRPAKGDDITNCPATATGGGSDDGQLLQCLCNSNCCVGPFSVSSASRDHEPSSTSHTSALH